MAVDKTSGTVRVVRLVEAFECGAIINPDGLRNQVVGAMIQGLGGALFEAIEFENGRIKNPHFASYRVPRFRDVPEIEAVVLDRKDIPSAGAGGTHESTAPAQWLASNPALPPRDVRLASRPFGSKGASHVYLRPLRGRSPTPWRARSSTFFARHPADPVTLTSRAALVRQTPQQ